MTECVKKMKVLRVIYPDFGRVLTSSRHNTVIWKLSVWAVRTDCTKGWKLAETPGSKGGGPVSGGHQCPEDHPRGQY